MQPKQAHQKSVAHLLACRKARDTGNGRMISIDFLFICADRECVCQQGAVQVAEGTRANAYVLLIIYDIFVNHAVRLACKGPG